MLPIATVTGVEWRWPVSVLVFISLIDWFLYVYFDLSLIIFDLTSRLEMAKFKFVQLGQASVNPPEVRGTSDFRHGCLQS